jgi:internalin A
MNLQDACNTASTLTIDTTKRKHPMPDQVMTPKQQTAYETALRKIEASHRGRKKVLDLSKLGLVKLPTEIGQLTALTQLDLTANQLSSLPPEIGRLTALTRLDLMENQLSSLPPGIGRLTALTHLNLRYNQLSSLTPEIGRLTALTHLDLTANQLSSLPPEIGQLTALTQLDLNNNLLNSLPQEIVQLTALTELNLDDNRLSDLPLEVFQLKALTNLSLHQNALTQLPAEIAQLTKLVNLSVGLNKVSYLPMEIGCLTELRVLAAGNNQLKCIPAEIGQLSNLQELYLWSNRLTNLPSEIVGLTKLTVLSLFDNSFSSLPPEICELRSLEELLLSKNQLTSLPVWLRQLPNLDRLFLHGNPALQLSPSILGEDIHGGGNAYASAKSILDFYFNRLQGETRSLNEVKLILVGRGGAGKTSTVQALQGLPFKEGEESTPGIALCDWTMTGCKKGPVTAHVWDFAGQVITHALHQFFFSMRSVYVVVLTGRENNERDDAEYWLRLIKAFGTDAQGNGPPVVITLNKWDKTGCRPSVDRSALQERYPFIHSFVEMDCKTNKGVGKLRAALSRVVDQLPWVREPFPAAWDAVRRALRTGRNRRAHLTYTEYRALCATHGVTDAGEQDSLAEILHHLGAALNYRNDSRLREATVLQPEWLTKNVYALVRRAEKKAGILLPADVATVLRGEKDLAMRAYLLKIMERFEIAYAVGALDAQDNAEGAVERWLVPQALPDIQPAGAMAFRDVVDATRLRYSYTALPEGLVARAIVRLHAFIEEVGDSKQQWASGVILSREGARALIRSEPQDRQVMITVTGSSKSRQQLAGLCQAEMRGIHAEIRGLNPTEETQVQGTWVATATLEADEQKNQKTGVATRDQGTLLVDPAEPNNAYSEKPARFDSVWKPTVFISYSKSDVSQRKRLELELKVLMNEGLLNSLWHDRMIDPGDEWNKTIQRELSEADVVLILASTAALATDYITKHEIPKALELHKASETVVVPVILEACRWNNSPLGELNALPEKGKPLNKWKPKSDGWNDVVNGLAKVCKALMEAGSTKRSGVRHRLFVSKR